MSGRSKAEATAETARSEEQPAPKPEPLRVVKRELTRPDGSTVVVDVPVYPPFELEGSPPESTPARREPTLSRRRKPPRDR